MRRIKIFQKALRAIYYYRFDANAAALTYYTLLAIVPIFAIAFGIAQSVGIEAYVNREINGLLRDHPEVAKKAVGFAHSTLAYIHVNLLTSTAALFLFWSAGTLLNNVEYAMNRIWGVKEERRFWRKSLIYLAVILFCPIFLALSSALSVAFNSIVFEVSAFLGLPPRHWFSQTVLSFLSFFFSWLFCASILLLMPNCRVPLKAAIFAGAVSGALFQLLQWGYFYLQNLLTSYSFIYGSFAALPLFLLWLQTSWLIILFGAVVAAVSANHLDTTFSRKT